MPTCAPLCEADQREVAGNYLVVQNKEELEVQSPYSGLLAYDATNGQLRIWERGGWGGVSTIAAGAYGLAFTNNDPPALAGGSMYLRPNVTTFAIQTGASRVVAPFAARLSAWYLVKLTKTLATQPWLLAAYDGSTYLSASSGVIGYFPTHTTTLACWVMYTGVIKAGQFITITGAVAPIVDVNGLATVPLGPVENHSTAMIVPWW